MTELPPTSAALLALYASYRTSKRTSDIKEEVPQAPSFSETSPQLAAAAQTQNESVGLNAVATSPALDAKWAAVRDMREALRPSADISDGPTKAGPAAAGLCRGPRAFYLLDGTCVQLPPLDVLNGGSITVGDVLEDAARVLDISPALTRYLALHSSTAEGVVDASPLNSRSTMEHAWGARFPAGEAGRLVLLVRLWTDELRRRVMSAHSDDAALTRLAFVQARTCMMMDLWPCPQEDAALVAAVQLSGLVRGGEQEEDAAPSSLRKKSRDAMRYESAVGSRAAPPTPLVREPGGEAGGRAGVSASRRLPPQAEETHTSKLVRDKLPSLLPERLLRARPSGQWEVDVHVELGFRLNDPHASAASDFLAIAETWDVFGTVAFSAMLVAPSKDVCRHLFQSDAAELAGDDSPPIECVLYAGRDGVRVLSPNRREVLGVLNTSQIARWGCHALRNTEATLHELYIDCALSSPSNIANSTVRCVFELHGSGEAAEIASLLDDYATLDWVENPPTHRYVRPHLPHARDSSGKMVVDTARTSGTDGGSQRPKKPPKTSQSPSQQKTMGTYLNNLYDSLVFAIIRPPRSLYDPRRLGPTSFVISDRTRFHRRDVKLRNARGEQLHCSHWVPAASYGEGYGSENSSLKRPCIIFMHANSAARVQALPYVSTVLSLGCTFFAFDCAGSGLSDGDYVSLGWRESRDLHVVTRYLRRLGSVSSLGAWGCSMGAASIIFYMAGAGDRSDAELPPAVAREQHSPTETEAADAGLASLVPDSTGAKSAPAGPSTLQGLDAVVLDSPYSDINQLAVDLAANRLIGGFSTPWVVTQAVLLFLESTISDIAGFSIVDLKPVSFAGQCAAPALFLHAEGDSLVGLPHLEVLVRAYGGPRVLAMVEGTHSSPRSKRTLEFVAAFLTKHMDVTPDASIADEFTLENVPWVRREHKLFKSSGLAYSLLE
ncbi:Alpha/Beta hydrolase protein [Pelagophyceae sp. CCMP2097]|nr:Alpha/Beta hydrolase protein [Pelagophyceae sp. CCMP2097]